MRKCLIASVLAVAGTLLSANAASAYGYGVIVRPYYTPAAFPCLNPAGYYSNAYYFAWYYPWFAQYNYSHGPYANWWHWGGYATYGGNCAHLHAHPAVGLHPHHPHPAPVNVEVKKASLSITLPADATLRFNGTAAEGTGSTRVFHTPDLAAGQDYAYDLTAEVVRNGQKQVITERVVVRAGEASAVTLDPTAVRTAAK